MAATTSVMATARRILENLNTSNDAKEDMIKIFSRFDDRLSNITGLMSYARISDGKADAAFEAAEKIILRWDSNSGSSRHSLPWEDSPVERAEYLSAVDEILQSIEDLTIQSDSDRAESAIQMAMSRLEDEFGHILVRNTVPLDAERLYGSIRRVSLSFASNVDLIHPDAIGDLKEIADRMIRSGYEKECCQVYSSVRRDVLDECISILGAEKLSIEEVQKIEWRSLDEKIKKWIQAVMAVRVLLSGEKRLCEQIFNGSQLIKEVCFVETAKGCVTQLLNFGEAVAFERRSPEKLFRMLDMHDVLVDVLPDILVLFTGELGESLCSEAQAVLDLLSEVAIGTFVEFENGVMNYVKLLVDYSDSLNAVLKNRADESDPCLVVAIIRS